MNLSMEFEGAYHHVLSRGNVRMDIFAQGIKRLHLNNKAKRKQ
ncbi:MAG: hypothetical protein QY310_00385 [Candidatus Jettenia sp. CY-1]|nr:MAG: hypothetical protein QY310_00385 [Candidatus Jettenia sp. CY-1]